MRGPGPAAVAGHDRLAPRVLLRDRVRVRAASGARRRAGDGAAARAAAARGAEAARRKEDRHDRRSAGRAAARAAARARDRAAPAGERSTGAGPPDERRAARRRVRAGLSNGPVAGTVALRAARRRAARRRHGAGFGAPMPPSDWTFQFSGFMNATAQFSVSQRPNPAPGQSSTVFHVPPQSVDEYQSFVGTATMPGQWVQMNFRYGNRDVSANLTLSTWNPSAADDLLPAGQPELHPERLPHLQHRADRPAAAARERRLLLHQLREPGAVRPPASTRARTSAAPRGVGADAGGQYALDPELSLLVEAGLMGNRNGRAPSGTAPPTRTTTPIRPSRSAYIGHLHAGLVYKSDFIVQGATCTGMFNWAMDDRVEYNTPVTTAMVPRDPMHSDNMVLHPRDRRVARPRRPASRCSAPTSQHDRTRSGGSWASAARTSTPRRLPAARPAHLRRRGAAADRALAGRRQRRHRPGRGGGHQLERQHRRILASPRRSTPTRPT